MTEEKSRYFMELTLNLQYEGFTAGQSEDGLMPVELDGQPLCRAMEGGGVRYRQEDVTGDNRGTALERVTDIAKATAEYMGQMEAAPQLTANGLTGDYRLLADFNDTVLAGHPTKYGVQFVTWDRVQNRTALDGHETALLLIDSGAGVVTPYGVAYDNGMVLEQCYNGHQLPAYPYDSLFMVLEVTPKQGLAEGQNPEYLYLPAAEHQIERTLLRIGITALSDTQVRLDFDELPEKVADALDLEHLSGDDLPGLNRMCRAIAPMKETDMEKLNAVVLMTETSGAVSICRLAENLDQFDFIPGIHTPEEYGRYMIRDDVKTSALLQLPEKQ